MKALCKRELKSNQKEGAYCRIKSENIYKTNKELLTVEDSTFDKDKEFIVSCRSVWLWNQLRYMIVQVLRTSLPIRYSGHDVAPKTATWFSPGPCPFNSYDCSQIRPLISLRKYSKKKILTTGQRSSKILLEAACSADCGKAMAAMGIIVRSSLWMSLCLT